MTQLHNARIAYAQEWTEYERGWGARPDGYSLHPTREAAVEFARAYTADRTGPAPDEYSAPEGQPFAVQVAEGVELDFGDKDCLWTMRGLPDGVTRL